MTDSEQAWTEATKASRLVARQVSFADWLVIARGLHAMRESIRAETGVQHDASPIFAKAMGEFARTHKWAARFMSDRKSSFRSASYFLVDNLKEIEAWRATLTEHDRARWRNPEVVVREFRRATRGAKPASPPSPKQQIVELRRENTALKRRVRELESQIVTRRRRETFDGWVATARGKADGKEGG